MIINRNLNKRKISVEANIFIVGCKATETHKKMKYLKTIITVGLFSILFGCDHNQNNQKKTDIKIEEITSRTDTSEGFSDIFLTIVNAQKNDSSFTYLGKGLYKGRIVGLKFELPSNIPYGITEDGEVNSKYGFVQEGIKFISIGQESDELLKALSELYNVQTQKKFSKKVITATIFSLNSTSADLEQNAYYKFKLFFNEDGDDGSYAELYFNIRTGEKIIELHEKDPEYRQPLIKVFSE